MSEDTSKELLTATDALNLIRDRAQRCREHGESDMRNIIYMAAALLDEVKAGKSRSEIMLDFATEDEEDDE